MKKSIVLFYLICVLAASAVAFGVVETPAFADVCYSGCDKPV